MKIAIVGGGNVYALNLAKHLHSLGIDHFGIGRSPRKQPAFWQVGHEYRYYQYHLLREFEAVLTLLDKEKPEIIINFAAQGESAASFGEHTHYYYDTNTSGLVRFAEALRHKKWLERFIQAGTSEVYGSTSQPSKESDPLRPSSPYAVSKAAFDQHLQIMHKVHGFPVNVLRPSNAFCPGQQLHRIIPRAIVCALSGRKMELHGGGRSLKSYMHATDLSRAIMAVIERGTVGRVYNCGPKHPTRIRDLVDLVITCCGTTFDELVDIVPQRTGEDECYWIDSGAISFDCKWEPKIKFYEGLPEMVSWVRSHPEIMDMDHSFKIAA